MQNKLYQEQIWMLSEDITKHIYLNYNHQVVRNLQSSEHKLYE